MYNIIKTCSARLEGVWAEIAQSGYILVDTTLCLSVLIQVYRRNLISSQWNVLSLPDVSLKLLWLSAILTQLLFDIAKSLFCSSESMPGLLLDTCRLTIALSAHYAVERQHFIWIDGVEQIVRTAYTSRMCQYRIAPELLYLEDDEDRALAGLPSAESSTYTAKTTRRR